MVEESQRVSRGNYIHIRMRHLVKAAQYVENIYISTDCYYFYFALKIGKHIVI
jgi:hypothetical protein